ncbi:hypothetical protein, partial [Treponema sp.]|uniref:hypothetical protein n=1 Tax=Treponema sp. TaxID=166 RepID=UPI0025D394B3
TVISLPEEEKLVSEWEENITLTPLYYEDGNFYGYKVSSFTYDGRITLPEFSVKGYAGDNGFELLEETERLTALPVFLSAEESSNGEADEVTNASLNFIVDRFSFENSDDEFNASFRLNFVSQNPDAKKGRASDSRVEINYMALLVTVSGGSSSSDGQIACKEVYKVVSPLTVSSAVAASPELKYTIVKNDSSIVIRMNAFSYSPKMRIGDIFMTADISEDGVISSAASKDNPLYSYTANDEKIMAVKIISLSGTYNDTEKKLNFSFIPGSMPLAISVETEDFIEVNE